MSFCGPGRLQTASRLSQRCRAAGVDPTGLQGETRIGFSARGAIMRRDFGISFGLAADSKIVVGDKVDITLDIQAVLDA